MYQNSLKTFLLCLLSLVSISAFAYEELLEVGDTFEDNGFKFRILDVEKKTVELTYLNEREPGYLGTGTSSEYENMTEVTIPDTATDGSSTEYTVTNIGDHAFYRCTKLTSLTIGKYVTVIDKYAFYRCEGLTNVTIPQNVRSIGDDAFEYCVNLETALIEDGVEEIGSGVFYGCYKLKDLTVPNSITTIGKNAFAQCSVLPTVNIPEGVTSIENGTFSVCKGLTSIKIPSSVTTIGSQAFTKCSSLTGIVIPDNVVTIGTMAFDECTSLSSVTIGSSVDTIAGSAFESCTALKEMVIPDNVKVIGSRAFYNCSSLTSVTIGSNVDSINYIAFPGCTSLETIVVKADNPNYSSRGGCNAIISKDGTLIAGCKTTVVPDGVTAIGKYAFYNSSIESVTIPDDVTSIGQSAFASCRYLTELTIGSNVTSIGNSALASCSNLTTVVSKIKVPSQVTFDTGDLGRGGLFGEVYREDQYSNIILYVPTGTVDAYQESEWGTYFKTVKEMEVESVSINLPTGYLFSTFSTNVALDFTDNTDAKAYTAKVVGETVELTPIDKVPANTGILIERISENSSTTVSVIADVELKDDNDLIAVTRPMSAEALVADNAYILVDDYQFARVLETASGSLAVGKAYLRGPENGSRSLTIGFGSNDDTTGLAGKVAEGAEQPIVIYNLNGQRIAQPTKGLYIVNGKKVIIK